MAISTAAYSGLSNGSTTDVSSFATSALSNKTKQLYSGSQNQKNYSTDSVSISQEALELSVELAARRSSKAMSVNENSKDTFGRVAKGLPNSETFNDMVAWVGTWAGGSVTNPNDAPDRNAYNKNPQKYVEMWKNLYDNYTETMKELGLNPEYSGHRDALHDERVSSKVQYVFLENLDKNTQGLMKMFNITV